MNCLFPGDLKTIDDVSVLELLKNRFSKNEIYVNSCTLKLMHSSYWYSMVLNWFFPFISQTNVADILLSLNPFKPLLKLHNVECNDLSQPHIFGTGKKNIGTMIIFYSFMRPQNKWNNWASIFLKISAKNAYSSMEKGKQSQTILISGLSGAGKTEAAKNILKWLCKSTRFEQEIISSITLLESFGNAQTGINNNSSRFCKFTKVSFCNFCFSLSL